MKAIMKWQAGWKEDADKCQGSGNYEIPYIGGQVKKLWVFCVFFSRMWDMTVVDFPPKTIPSIVLQNTSWNQK